jgi:hypothetical protein
MEPGSALCSHTRHRARTIGRKFQAAEGIPIDGLATHVALLRDEVHGSPTALHSRRRLPQHQAHMS